MSNSFTLDSIREETERQLAPITIGLKDGSEVTLVSLLRLGAKARESVQTTLTDMGDAEIDQDSSPEELAHLAESLSEVFRKIADRPNELLSELASGSDPLVNVTLMAQILHRWMGVTQSGEASPSPA
jgi:hypothetical protein